MFSQRITPGDDGLGENQKHKREVSVFLNSSFKKYKLKKNLICTRLRTFVKPGFTSVPSEHTQCTYT